MGRQKAKTKKDEEEVIDTPDAETAFDEQTTEVGVAFSSYLDVKGIEPKSRKSLFETANVLGEIVTDCGINVDEIEDDFRFDDEDELCHMEMYPARLPKDGKKREYGFRLEYGWNGNSRYDHNCRISTAKPLEMEIMLFGVTKLMAVAAQKINRKKGVLERLKFSSICDVPKLLRAASKAAKRKPKEKTVK